MRNRDWIKNVLPKKEGPVLEVVDGPSLIPDAQGPITHMAGPWGQSFQRESDGDIFVSSPPADQNPNKTPQAIDEWGNLPED